MDELVHDTFPVEDNEVDPKIAEHTFVNEKKKILQPSNWTEYMQDRDYDLRVTKVTEVLASWKETQDHERGLRKEIASFVLWSMSFLIMAGIVLFTLMGFKVLDIADKWVADVFFGSVFLAVAGLASSVVKGLFPKEKSDTLSEMNKIVEKL